MSLDFLSVDAATAHDGAAPVAHSPMEPQAGAAGARFELRDGWSVAVAYGPADREQRVRRTSVGWADSSHLGKLEVQGDREQVAEVVARWADDALPDPGRASRAAGGWWCPVTPQKVLVLCPSAATGALRRRLAAAAADAGPGAGVVDVTTAWAAITIAGPLARETLARFCALDLRPAAAPRHAFRPGSVARTPGMVLREDDDRYLMLFGWALGRYLWTVVADAAGSLGGSPVGADAVEPIEEPAPPIEEAPSA